MKNPSKPLTTPVDKKGGEWVRRSDYNELARRLEERTALYDKAFDKINEMAERLISAEAALKRARELLRQYLRHPDDPGLAERIQKELNRMKESERG